MNYHLNVDEAQGRVHFQAKGLWDRALAERYLADCTSIRSWAIKANIALTVLAELSELSILPQEVSSIVSSGSVKLSGSLVSRSAIVATSSLMRLQARRIDQSPNRRIFVDVAEAAHWLGWEDGFQFRTSRMQNPWVLGQS